MFSLHYENLPGLKPAPTFNNSMYAGFRVFSQFFTQISLDSHENILRLLKSSLDCLSLLFSRSSLRAEKSRIGDLRFVEVSQQRRKKQPKVEGGTNLTKALSQAEMTTL